MCTCGVGCLKQGGVGGLKQGNVYLWGGVFETGECVPVGWGVGGLKQVNV